MKKNLLVLLLCGIAFASSAYAGSNYEVWDLEGNKIPRNLRDRKPTTPPTYTEEKPNIPFKPQPVWKIPTVMTPEFLVQMGFPTHNLMYMLFLNDEEARKAEGRVVYFEYRNYIGWLQVTYCRVFELPENSDYYFDSTASVESTLESIEGFKESTKTPYDLVTDIHLDRNHNVIHTSQSGKEPQTHLTRAVYGLKHKKQLLFMLCRRMRQEESGKTFPNHAQFTTSLPATYGNFMLVERDDSDQS